MECSTLHSEAPFTNTVRLLTTRLFEIHAIFSEIANSDNSFVQREGRLQNKKFQNYQEVAFLHPVLLSF